MARFRLGLCLIVLCSACNTTTFRAENQKLPAGPQDLSFTCEDKDKVLEVQGDDDMLLSVKGALCFKEPPAPPPSRLYILFVVDISGSMVLNDKLPDDGSGACGRFKAAEAVVNKVSEEFLNKPDNQVDVLYSVVTFDFRAEQKLAFTKDLKRFLKKDLFCGYGDETNYKAAFDEARASLRNLQGAKTVYFISDGAPTAPETSDPNEPYQKGLSAAERLRELTDITINAIYLQNQLVGGKYDDQLAFDPEEYLLKVIGGKKERVALVSNADELSLAIVKFEIPEQKNSISFPVLTLVAPDGSEKPVKVTEFTEDKSQKGKFRIRTESFRLAKKGQQWQLKILLDKQKETIRIKHK